ncbi:MAG: class I SAM-dependent methyltransferase [Chloroflexi bacterium]|nr:MAG: class I SAM-dependent methyltransferase [Chloroflexota bacterium]
MRDHATEAGRGVRFEFGNNWRKFLQLLNEERVAKAQDSLKHLLTIKDLEGQTFLDIGCGSGLFSLAARRLGARVHSFDYDPQSVACTAELRRHFFPEDSNWIVETGSALDGAYMKSLGQFDVVYSWGVLHHTGVMWSALDNVRDLVKPEGKLALAIYNDQGRASRYWMIVKKTYNLLPTGLRWLVLWPAFIRLWGPTFVRELVRGTPFRTWNEYSDTRSMSPWRDVVDWVGGYPFEVAKPEDVFEFYRMRGLKMIHLKSCGGGHGCNEFVFIHDRQQAQGSGPSPVGLDV